MNRSKRVCFKPVSKGIPLLLAWEVLLSVSIAFTINVFVVLLSSDNNKDLQLYLYYYIWSAVWVLLPVAGWMGDSYLGRYRAITAGVILTMLSFLILLCATVMLQFNWTPIPAFVMLILNMLVTTFSMGSFAISMLPFIIDQMIGASADDISAIVQWWFWSDSLGVCILYPFLFLPIDQLHQNLTAVSVTMIISLLVISFNNRLSVSQMAWYPLQE